MGNRPAFFVLSCHVFEHGLRNQLNPVVASCARIINSPEVAMLLFDSRVICFQPEIRLSGGIGMVLWYIPNEFVMFVRFFRL